MSVFIFTGVGSHLLGMGKEFFDEYQKQIKIADQVLGYSIKELCLEDPRHLLDHSEYVQPALFIVGMLNFWNKLATGTPSPHYLAGHSMGETCALCCAGVFDFETGVRLSQHRGKLMAKLGVGGMAVIIGLNAMEVRAVLKVNRLDGLDISNINSNLQIVISGSMEDILLGQSVFEKADVIYVQLPVDRPYHSRYMKKTRDEFYDVLKDFKFSPLKMPVIANIDGKPYLEHQIKQGFADQIDHCVLWQDSMEYLLAKGQTDFEEIGSGSVLTGFLRQIKKDWKRKC